MKRLSEWAKSACSQATSPHASGPKWLVSIEKAAAAVTIVLGLAVLPVACGGTESASPDGHSTGAGGTHYQGGSGGASGMSGADDGDEVGTDADGDGWAAEWGDCNDGDPSINPGAQEVPDGIDNNCNGLIDEEGGGGDSPVVATDKVAGKDYCYATEFQYPVGEGAAYTHCKDGDGWYVFTEFRKAACKPGSAIKTHLGQDWNGEGGGCTDKGQAVHAVADGVVVYVKLTKGDGWGQVIIVRHDAPPGAEFVLPDGGTAAYVYSLHGHLQNITVAKGAAVTRGQTMAEIGPYPGGACHLHWEIITPSATLFPGPGYSATDQGRVDPSDFVDSNATVVPKCGADGQACCQPACGGTATCSTGFECGPEGTCEANIKLCVWDSDCADANPCTADACKSFVCAHSAMSDGTACGSDHVCVSGACVLKSPLCNDECGPAGATQCSDAWTLQTCGNYDADPCLEWGLQASCAYGCSAGACAKDACAGKACNSPPAGGCYDPTGACNGTGTCTYSFKPAGTACDDGNPATLGDHCDGAGKCSGTPCSTTYSADWICDNYRVGSGGGAGGGEIMNICVKLNADGSVTLKAKKKDGSVFSARPYAFRVSQPSDNAGSCALASWFITSAAYPSQPGKAVISGVGTNTLTTTFMPTWNAEVSKSWCLTAEVTPSDPGYTGSASQQAWWYSPKATVTRSVCQ